MASETDFFDLYRKLGLSPGCGLLELKRAYRRHVSMLHPDHRVGNPLDARAAERLQRLTAQYGAAMEFQRRHGRLPGAPGSSRPAAPETAAPAWRQPPAVQLDAPSQERPKVLILLLAAALGVSLWNVASLPPEIMSSSPVAASAAVGWTVADDPPALRPGMSPDEVLAAEGEPTAVQGDRWEYGPSWIRFEHDEVVDWYSSPLHALRTASVRPAPPAAEMAIR
ncbi:hypothetical protein ASG87_11635 [Frateuria sp. Soil773]|uniref:J domain-containing protein n=1 Tax=Frateuria sp. Soil773 TaxID=1736407 RepID=UPI0006F89731|nr:J domain-containing protein [Frateuria sp. Soil773]KRF02124.1 hypothetical protein ASG87_11635 [Frateuria sp. Soil773]